MPLLITCTLYGKIVIIGGGFAGLNLVKRLDPENTGYL